MAREECRIHAEQTGPQGSPEGKARQSSTSASRYIPKYGNPTTKQRKICEPKSRPRLFLSKTTTYSSATTSTFSNTGPYAVRRNRLEDQDIAERARHHGVNVRREDSALRLPKSRRTRTRTDTRPVHVQGAFWANTGRQSRREAPNVPEPPAPPPRRQTGAKIA